MPPESLLAALEASPSYGTLPRPQLELVLRAAETLAAAGNGLAVDRLSKALRQWFSRERLDDTLVPTLERFGVFRRTIDLDWTLAELEALDRPFEELPVCVLDVEATGGRPPLHRIIELGAVRLEPDGTRSTLDLLINPSRPLPPFIARMTGLSQAQLDNAPRFADALERIEAFLDGTILVCHNVQGDVELLNYEFYRNRGRLLANPVFCSMAATKLLRPKIEASGLEAVARELGIEFDQAHRAFADAQATAGVWLELRKDLLSLGTRTLLDLSCYQGQIGESQFIANRITVERLDEVPSGPGYFKLLGQAGRLVHAEAAGDLKGAVKGYFYPRYKLPPYVKRMLRDTLDFTWHSSPTLEEARAAIGSKRTATASRGRGRRRR